MARSRAWTFSAAVPRSSRSPRAASAAACRAPARHLKADAQRLGQLPGAGRGPRIGVAGGDGNGRDPLRSQGLGGDGGHDGRVDAAGQPQKGALQAGSCGKSRARPGPGPGRVLLRVLTRLRLNGRLAVQVDHADLFLKAGQLGEELAVCVRRQSCGRQRSARRLRRRG